MQRSSVNIKPPLVGMRSSYGIWAHMDQKILHSHAVFALAVEVKTAFGGRIISLSISVPTIAKTLASRIANNGRMPYLFAILLAIVALKMAASKNRLPTKATEISLET